MSEASDKAEDEFCDMIGACHCGAPEEGMGQMRWALEAVARPEYVPIPMLVLYYLDTRELIEHGSTVTSSWLTPKGKKLLEWLQAQNAAPIEMLAVTRPA
jgi:hypothetical protein